jgi:hypothetical protein
MAEADDLRFLIEQGRMWIANERIVRRPQAQPLSDSLCRRFEPYFPAPILDAARIQSVSTIANPPFYAALTAVGQPIPLDFSQMAGITFIDTILVAQPKVAPVAWEELLFHECVHVVQYALLGVDRFVDQYVNGWAMNGRQYDRIPLEAEAYHLQSAFTRNPGLAFSVEAAVRKRLGM